MQKIALNSTLALSGVLMGLLMFLPGPVKADGTPTGQAQVVKAVVLGATTILADTGTLVDKTDARSNSLAEGSVVSTTLGEVLRADVLHATTTAGVDQVDSTSSLADLAVNISDGLGGLTTVAAEFARSEARAVSGGIGSGTVMIDGLSINGVSTVVTGEANQVVPLVGGQVVINEQESVPGGIRVNALHILIDGVADLVIASSTAGLP